MKNKLNHDKIKLSKRKIIPILKKHDVIRASIFGSFARGEGRKNSDIDILIRFKGQKSLLDLVELEMALQKALQRKVDLLTFKSVHPLLKERILSEQKVIL